ncbi:hypothetical protein C5167_023045, partial [Papaver somniferum]
MVIGSGMSVGIVSELSDDWLSTRNNWGILNDGGEGMKKEEDVEDAASELGILSCLSQQYSYEFNFPNKQVGGWTQQYKALIFVSGREAGLDIPVCKHK